MANVFYHIFLNPKLTLNCVAVGGLRCFGSIDFLNMFAARTVKDLGFRVVSEKWELRKQEERPYGSSPGRTSSWPSS